MGSEPTPEIPCEFDVLKVMRHQHCIFGRRQSITEKVVEILAGDSPPAPFSFCMAAVEEVVPIREPPKMSCWWLFGVRNKQWLLEHDSPVKVHVGLSN